MKIYFLQEGLSSEVSPRGMFFS